MKEKILLGGYTKRVSKGVYSVLLDTKAAELSSLNEVAAVQNPTYITLDEKGHLYTCAADSNGGGIAALILMAKLLLISEMSQPRELHSAMLPWTKRDN